MSRANATGAEDSAYRNYQKFLRKHNASGRINLTAWSGDDYDWGPGGPAGEDRVPLVVILGVFFSVCAAISLLVLLAVYCSQSRARWPFRRRATGKDAAAAAADADAEAGGEQQALWTRTEGGEGALMLEMDAAPDQQQPARPPSRRHSSSSSDSGAPAAPGPAKAKTKVPSVARDEKMQDSLLLELRQKQASADQ